MAYNTGSELGSTDPRDLSDNSANFDKAINDTANPTWTDRLGKSRITLANQLGYNFKGDYAAGIELSSYTDIIRYSGEFYGPAASATLPYTTTATLPDADSNLVPRGDLVIRQELSGEPIDGKGAALVTGATTYVGSVAENFSGRSVEEGKNYSVMGWHSGSAVQISPAGGGQFLGRASISKSEHNGITIISPTVPPVSAQAGVNLAEKRDNFLSGAGETDAGGTGVFARTSGVIDVTMAGAVAHDVAVDDLGAFNAALAASLSVYVPDGDGYYVSAPITSLQNMALYGEDEVPVDKARGAKIYAPNGFLINTLSSRHRVAIRNLWPIGDGRAAAGIVGIDGQFGGLFEGNHFEGFDITVENPMSFLTDFIRNKFTDTNIGLYLSTANEVNILRNLFQSSCIKAIDTYNLTPAAGGGRAAFPVTVSGNNFNMGTGTEPSILSGQVNYERNYVEVFSGPATPYIFEFVAMRFANPTLNVTDNHINGQGNIPSHIQIYSDNAAGAVVRGEIKRNYLRGTTAEAIVFGEKGGFFGNVTGIEIDQNTASVSPYVRYPSTDYGTPPQNWGINYTAGTLDVSGTTFVSIPFNLKSGFLPIDLQASGTLWNVSKTGLYLVSGSIIQAYSADIRNSEIRVYLNGATVLYQALASLSVAQTGTNYNTISFSIPFSLSSGDDVEFQVRNGETIYRAEVGISEIPRIDQYTAV